MFPKMTDARKASPANGDGDRFSFFHLYAWLGLGLLVYLSDEINRLLALWILLVPLLVIPAVTLACMFVGGFIRNLWLRRWRSLVSVLVAPVVTAILFGGLVRYQLTPDWFRFQLTRPYYAWRVHNLPGPSPRYHEWYWGETGGVATANIFYKLVYDETDKPLDRSAPGGQEGAEYTVRSVGNHFFLVAQIYQ